MPTIDLVDCPVRRDPLVDLAKAAELRSTYDWRTDDYEELDMEVAQLLFRNPEVLSEGPCLEAATWAVRMNPERQSPHSLVDDAFAKYCELTS